jgi:hypothetical protein
MSAAINWSAWRSAPDARYADDFSPHFVQALDGAAEAHATLRNAPAGERTLAVLCSVYNGSTLIPGTLRELVQLLRAGGYGADLFIILNAGGGSAREALLRRGLPADLARLKREFHVDEALLGRTDARGIRLDWEPEDLAPGRIRLILIDQTARSEAERGKSVAVQLAMEFFREAALKSGYGPQYMLMIDAETRLRRVDLARSRYAVQTETPAGLEEILQAVQPGRQFSGSRLFMTHFDESGEPEWGRKTPPLQHTSTVMMGSWALSTLNGGATAGDFRDLLAINLGWTRAYPRCRIEDSLMCFMIRALGAGYAVLDDVVHANICPSLPVDAMNQFLRWRQGLAALRREVGERYYATIYKSSATYFLYVLYARLRWSDFVRFRDILPGMPQVEHLDYVATRQPDDWIHGSAAW